MATTVNTKTNISLPGTDPHVNAIQAASITVVASIPLTASLATYNTTDVIMIEFLDDVIYSDASDGEEASLIAGAIIHCAGVAEIFVKTAGTTPITALLFK